MKRTVSLTTYIISVIVALGVGAGVGVLGYVYFVGGSGEVSREVQAATIAPGGAANDRVETFTIVPAESTVSFTLDEDLMGRRNTVVGTTKQVTGNIAVNFDNPAATEVGAIEINLRNLATDNEFRNRAMRDQILESNRAEYEFTTFTPTGISGLPESVAVGDTFDFTLTGDLPLRGITHSVEWAVTVTLVSESRIEGTATAVITRTAYNLTIPNVPTVANVEDEVDLKIEFVAIAQ